MSSQLTYEQRIHLAPGPPAPPPADRPLTPDRGTESPTARGPVVSEPWTLCFDGFEPDDEGRREALCAVGNGYLVTRGAAPESRADGVHYPGTYLAGCYNIVRSSLHGMEVEHEDLVNCPNWLPLTFRAAGTSDWFGEEGVELLDQRLELDLRNGVLTRTAMVRDAEGRRTRLRQRRLAAMGRPHLVALETVLTPENWSGRMEIRSALDGEIANTGVPRYRELTSHHLDPVGRGTDGRDTLWVKVRTTGSPLHIATAARTRVAGADAGGLFRLDRAWAAHLLTVDAAEGRPVTVEKAAAVYTSRDPAVADPLSAARQAIAAAPDFDTLAADNELRWAELWRRVRTDVGFAGAGTLHLHLFHLLQTYSEHSVDLDVGIPARGLHGEAYRGHVFWDELFVLALTDLRVPELSRGVLRYRYRRLNAARQAARDLGRRGAVYPWQSASEGHEESQFVHLNPLSGRWLPDNTRLQRHIGLAVAYNVWHYYQATGDVEFLANAGAEMLLEIARFWADSAAWDGTLERYVIRGVMGPDEYHDAYPWSETPGLNDNTYTNILASWTLARAADVLSALPAYRRAELCERLELYPHELQRWQQIGRRLHIPFHEGVLSQFDEYERLEELDWEGYRARYPDLRRLDRVLESEGDTVNRYKASKQADVLMLYYLFSEHELRELLRRLGYPAEPDLLQRTMEYYLRRTVHGSTLSSVVHAWVLARSDRETSWRFFRDALASDLYDVQGGTTAEGIHLGAMAGTVDLVQRCYLGLEIRGDALWLDPSLPTELGRLAVELRYRGHWGVLVEVDRHTVSVSLPPSSQPPIRIGLRGSVVAVGPGESRTFTL